MAFDHPDMTGTLFPNDGAKENPSQPIYRGSCKVNGVALDVSMWAGTTKDGKRKKVSLKFQPPFVKSDAPIESKKTPEEDENLPF